ncbi:tumor necrosis factor receptor superfamily member 16 [Alosa sapidissima]|uniref:tumor necrosis factor receptor superfamily member 16 n=1 Tax=Alosa sapidissima TaxID=34773 RepID=UPI001C0920C2|nr:tumor necrosis factor receptor superfamily member 16 [Alosa sapidissima]
MGTLSLVLLSGVVVLALGSKLQQAVQEEEDDEECESGQYTRSGECCNQCPPGEGVITPCGARQTVCGLCLDSETYSETYSHTEPCKTCTECLGMMRMLTPCTDSNDAMCVCDYGFFLGPMSGHCEPCTVCPRGEGVLSGCDHHRDTVCEPCLDSSYSQHDSSLDPCLPCTICEDNEVLMRNCTPEIDAICHDPNAPTYPPTPTFSLLPSDFDPTMPDDSLSPTPGGESTTANPSSPRYIGHGFNENLIPIYCSILAAVVVGLLAYIIFKRWNSCKQNKQAANNRAATANQTPSPEGEKLHSDSGISVDSQSLQEQQAAQQAQAQSPGQGPTQSHSQTQMQTHAPEQIVVRMDGAGQPDSPPAQA